MQEIRSDSDTEEYPKEQVPIAKKLRNSFLEQELDEQEEDDPKESNEYDDAEDQEEANGNDELEQTEAFEEVSPFYSI